MLILAIQNYIDKPNNSNCSKCTLGETSSLLSNKPERVAGLHILLLIYIILASLLYVEVNEEKKAFIVCYKGTDHASYKRPPVNEHTATDIVLNLRL